MYASHSAARPVIEYVSARRGSASTVLNPCRMALPGENYQVFEAPTEDGKKASQPLFQWLSSDPEAGLSSSKHAAGIVRQTFAAPPRFV